MSINNTFAKSFNVNHLKLTPEKLAEWDKRHSSNTLSLSQDEATTITSKYFNYVNNKQNSQSMSMQYKPIHLMELKPKISKIINI